MNMAGYPSFKSIWRLFYCQDQIIGDYLEIILLSIPNIIIWENIWRLFCRQAQMVIEVNVRVRCIILHWVTMTSYLLAPALFNSKKIYLLILWLRTNWKYFSVPPLLTKENISFSICGDYDSEKNISLHISWLGANWSPSLPLTCGGHNSFFPVDNVLGKVRH